MTTPATAQHTPGPWTAHDDDGTGTLPCVLSERVNAGGNFYVAQCNVYADARLIALAPEMAAEIESTFFALGRLGANGDIRHPCRPLWEKLRSLLARIEGR